jgi:acetyltransferase-like isoleucine patch superfamily enzyme
MDLINKKIIKQFLLTGKFLTPESYLRKLGVMIGKNCFISPCKVVGYEGYLIEIGDYVRISQNVKFFTHGLIIMLRERHNDPELDYFGKIKIGNYTSIGEGVRIIAGVTIGENVIIGTGSVVTKSIPDNCIAAGNPAQIIGNTDEFYSRIKMNYNTKSGLMSNKSKKELLLSLPEEAFIRKPFIQI